MSPVTIDDSVYNTMCEVADANNLHEAFILAKQGTSWKESVQRYEINELKYILKAQKKIYQGYSPTQSNSFILHERGKVRLIKPHTVEDRVVYKSFNRNVVLPNVMPRLIYDNGASLKDKGLSFAIKRFEIHIRNAYKEYGENAYILFVDFAKYFDNIDHEIYIKQCDFLNAGQMIMMENYLHSCNIDVSNMNDSEYIANYDVPINLLKHSLRYSNHEGKKVYKRSVGIGSENAQTAGIYLPYKVDNYIKIIRGIKYYGRYMDDLYIILPDKQQLKILLDDIEAECKKLRIFINRKKTHIAKITGKFTYLKINYIFHNGRFIRKVSNQNLRRERRRLGKFLGLMLKGKMTTDDIIQCYKSWRGFYKKFDNGYKIKRMDEYFILLFGLTKEAIA